MTIAVKSQMNIEQYMTQLGQQAREASRILDPTDTAAKNTALLAMADAIEARSSQLIEENANLLYESGEIGYLEFVQNLTTSLQIQEDYWSLLNEYNQLVIEMYYYLDI